MFTHLVKILDATLKCLWIKKQKNIQHLKTRAAQYTKYIDTEINLYVLQERKQQLIEREEAEKARQANIQARLAGVDISSTREQHTDPPAVNGHADTVQTSTSKRKGINMYDFIADMFIQVHNFAVFNIHVLN